MSTLTTTQTKVLSEAALTQLLPNALVHRGKCEDINNCLQPGFWFTSINVLNCPASQPYGILMVLASPLYAVQVYWPIGQKLIYSRTAELYLNPVGYSPWGTITLT